MVKPRRLGWDACTWIATIIQEKVPMKGGGFENRGELCNYVVEQAARKQIEIATSGLSLAEVCKDPSVKGTDGDVLADFFRNDFILIVPVDRHVGTLARELMQAGHAGLKPPDAVHLASAIVAEVTEFQTFDSKLLNLDGKINRLDGGVLKICKPPTPPPTLFDGI